MFCRVAQVTIVVRGLASPLLGAHIYWFVIWFWLVWSMALFFLSQFLFLLCFGLGFVYFGACKLASKQLDKQPSEPQNEQPTSSQTGKQAVRVLSQYIIKKKVNMVAA